METYTSYVVKRSDGIMVNIHYEPVKTIRSALRFHNVEDFQKFIEGYYKPDNPEDYYLQQIETIYKEVKQEEINNVQ